MADTSSAAGPVSFDEVAWLRDNSPAWRLLRADHASLVLSFLHQVFVAENVRSIPAAELASRLDDELYALNERNGQNEPKRFPRPAKAYLDDWAAPEAGWLGLLDPSAVRDRYQQFSATARELLADFREVEENFRKLDRQLREKITGWHGGKGELLDDVLGSRETIAGSDQGRSFQAFYDFLLSQARQEELTGLLDSVHHLSDLTG